MMPRYSTPMLFLLATSASATNPAGCECTGVNTGINTATYGADYGTRCAAWEDGSSNMAPSAVSCNDPSFTNTGKWCCRPWCYVNPATCNGAVTPYYASFFQSQAQSFGTLYYSYVACDSTTPTTNPNDVTYQYQSNQCPWTGPVLYTPSVRVAIQIHDFGMGGGFGCDTCASRSSVRTGCVANTLTNGKPTLASGADLGGECNGFESEAAFGRWWHGLPSATATLEFCFDVTTGYHTFDSTRFLPLRRDDGLFTTEMTVFFRYNGGEVFSFRGDDDVFVFIDNRLVVDIGGCHGAKPGSVSLDNITGLTIGQNYELKLFQAERCFGESNFKAEMTLRQDQGVCPNQCNMAREHGTCNLASGTCVCTPDWTGVDCGTPVANVLNEICDLGVLGSCTPSSYSWVSETSCSIGSPKCSVTGGDGETCMWPPPSPQPCFPSTATVTNADDGTTITIDTLKEGDEIVAATADGSLTTDTVSIFSLADNKAEATFIKLNTDGGRTLTLTPTHHLPVGASCCSNLKMAKEVAIGETLWVHESGAIVSQTVASKGLAIERGLHNPLLTNGNFPIVDGVATSFNTQRIVTFDSYAVPVVEGLCAATGTCDTVRKAIASIECAYKTLFGDGVCKSFKYVDGYAIVAASGYDEKKPSEASLQPMVAAASCAAKD